MDAAINHYIEAFGGCDIPKRPRWLAIVESYRSLDTWGKPSGWEIQMNFFLANDAYPILNQLTARKEAGGVDGFGCMGENGLGKKVCYEWGNF